MNWDWEFIWDILPQLARGAVVTFELTALGTLIAMTFGLILAIMRRSPFRPVSALTGAFIEFVRSTPLLVQALLFFYVLPNFGILFPPFITGMLAVGIHYSTYTAEVYRAGIEGVPSGQWEAATALNLPSSRVWLAVVLPQAIRRVIPALGNYVISMVKEIPLLLAIGVLGVAGIANQIASDTFRYVIPYTLAGIFFLLFSLVAARAVRMLERRLGHY